MESIKRTFTNDSDVNSYTSYESDYNSTYYQKRKDKEPPRYERYNDQYDTFKEGKNNRSFSKKNSKYSQDRHGSYQGLNHSHQTPDENQWNEEDDDWF